MKLVLVNNKSDKEYTISSKNNFGIDFDYVGTLVCINQKIKTEKGNFRCIARFEEKQFSILSCEWQTFDIKQEEQPAQ